MLCAVVAQEVNASACAANCCHRGRCAFWSYTHEVYTLSKEPMPGSFTSNGSQLVARSFGE